MTNYIFIFTLTVTAVLDDKNYRFYYKDFHYNFFLFYTSKNKVKKIVIKINFLFEMSGSCQSRNVPTYLAAPEAAG